MSSKINANAPSTPSAMPWEDRAPGHVQGLRRAITAHREDRPIDAEVAPMMGDMLARIDQFTAPDAPDHLPQPQIQGPEPTASQNLQALSQVSQGLKQARGQEPDADRAQRLDAMLAVIDQHVAMKREVVQRVQLQEQP